MSGEEGTRPGAPDRPAFAASFPKDEALDALVADFERGDYRRVREEAPGLAARTTDPEVRRAAEELHARTSPDPLAKWLFFLAFALLLTLSLYWIRHDGPDPSAPAPKAPPPTIEYIR